MSVVDGAFTEMNLYSHWWNSIVICSHCFLSFLKPYLTQNPISRVAKMMSFVGGRCLIVQCFPLRGSVQ